MDKPEELNKKTIGAFSYYYDRATEYGLIGKWITVGMLWKVLSAFWIYFSWMCYGILQISYELWFLLRKKICFIYIYI